MSYKRRMQNYELLRIVACIFVLVIHVSQLWIKYLNSNPGLSLKISELFPPVFCNSLSKIAVPLFLMLGGGMVLSNDKNSDYRLFYKKSFFNIGIVTINFSLLFTVYSIARNLKHIGNDINTVNAIINPLLDSFLGKPMYHMWYMFVLIGIYFMVPFIMIIKEKTGEQRFFCISTIFSVFTIVSCWLVNDYFAEWNIGKIIGLLGYFLLGYTIRKHRIFKHSFSCFMIGIVCVFILTVVRSYFYSVSIYPDSLRFNLDNICSPFIFISSVLIYTGFTVLNVRENKVLQFFSPLTLYVYLIHPVVLDFLTVRFQVETMKYSVVMIISLSIGLVIVSGLVGIFYEKLWKWLDKRHDLGNRYYSICKAIILRLCRLLSYVGACGNG